MFLPLADTSLKTEIKESLNPDYALDDIDIFFFQIINDLGSNA